MPAAHLSNDSILIASDSPTEAQLVHSLLEAQYGNLIVCAEPERIAAAFDEHCPQVLLLVFKELRKSEMHYLEIFRHGRGRVAEQRHRAIALCGREAAEQAYELCMRGVFDDYVLFWPMAQDARRLHMAVRLALQQLRSSPLSEQLGPSVVRESAKLKKLEQELGRQGALGSEYLALVGREVERTEVAARSGARSPVLSEQAATTIIEGLHRISESLRPLTSWARGIQQSAASAHDSVRQIGDFASTQSPAIMVVDDDLFQRQLITSMLSASKCELRFANSASEALSMLARVRADVVLTDYQMPEMNGIEFVRILKATPELADIPVVVVTGSNTRNVVASSIDAGAIDFLVKPFQREVLIQKIARLVPI